MLRGEGSCLRLIVTDGHNSKPIRLKSQFSSMIVGNRTFFLVHYSLDMRQTALYQSSIQCMRILFFIFRIRVTFVL